jgi:SAM-dependent methyltransferase
VKELVETAARFSGRVDDYARYRPSYPKEAIDAILLGMGDPRRLDVVDVGAGTGIAALLIAARGARVIAIEPNPEMRGAAAGAGIDARDGLADRTGLPDGSADIITSFQAFHWFANGTAVQEFLRVLRPGGRVALAWNARDDGDPFTRGYGDIADRDGHASRGGAVVDDYDYVPPLLSASHLRDVRELEFPSEQALDLEGLLGRARSASYAPREGEAYAALVERLTALHARFGDAAGSVVLRYRTRVYLAETSA